MNNATLVLNVARPSAPATPPAAAHAVDDATPSKRFDAALDAAHADARAPRKPEQEATKENAPPAKTPDAKATVDHDDKPAKKDDAPSDGTSIATAMLSLIGVPPTVAGGAAQALGVAKGAGDAGKDAAVGAAGNALSLAGMVPGTTGEIDTGASLKETAGASLGMGADTLSAGSTPVPAVTTSSFTALLATQMDGKAPKDDGVSVDAAQGGPMPFAHAQGLGQGAAPVMQFQATQPATSPQFAQEFGEQIAWMGSGQVKEARIKLHPEELGSMDVRVSLDGGKVNVAVIAQHPAAVHAVQQTLSQLDSMLAHHGLSLGQADVGQRQAEQGTGGGNGSAPGQSGDAGTTGAETVTTSRVSRGLVDEVA
ncbi:flagellar hook-length control protein FliK [Luteibacter sp. SG786]|uniref:flagellar hook-length control protein FliK n=1 Tax=Luteibacter sp. SG786 TaxID=2587130 RepID=UPI001422C7AB|nr:flagellar hook-length control protein FliK [Luteibacter sp. SG786]NII54208.1 flagellar hook-length control protein FliK [Luteibacter sp. SG786]